MNKIFAPFLPPWVETGLQPAFYDMESGTVLQQTARMYAKVQQLTRLFNEFSEDVSNEVNNFEHDINETVQEYIDKFVELKDFVDDYFDNLDVQEEINNKLDAMVEDGTLQKLIDNYLQPNVAWTFNSVAEMKTATNLVEDGYAQTYGFYNANDGGNAKYKIRAIEENETPDEKFVISLADENLVAELITDDMVNICQVGGQQNFASVFNYLISNGKKVYVPAGDYTATDTITITGNTIVLCDGNITLDATDKPLFVIQDRSKKKLTFNGNITTTGNVAFCIGNGEYAYHTDLYVKNIADCSTGILINPNGNKGVAWSRFEFRHITATTVGIDFAAGDSNHPFINANTFIGGDIESPLGIRTRKGANQNDRYNDNDFERIGFTGSIQCCIDLQFMERSWFDKLRISENLVGQYYIKLDDCRSIEISNESSIWVNKVYMTNNNSLYQHKFIANDIAGSDGNFAGKSAITTQNGNFIVDDIVNPERAFLNGYHKVDENTTEWEHLPDYYYEGMSVVVGHDYGNRTSSLTLPDAFSKRGIREFVIYCRYLNSSSTVTLTDVDNNTITVPHSTNIANKAWLCKYIPRSESGYWKLVELT